MSADEEPGELLCSFVVPIYNDGALARAFCLSFQTALQAYFGGADLDGKAELIFVNDGSANASFQSLAELAQEFSWVRAVDLSRNFGQHVAVSCGYAEARGQFVGMLNVDQEDPPDQIPLLLDAIRSGEHDIVVGLRAGYKPPLTSRLFNWLLNRLTGVSAPLNESTLRVMNRDFVNAYNELTERTRFIPGLEHWLGFRRGHVAVTRQARKEGRSSYSFRSRVLMAIESIVGFSDLPLRMATAAGFAVAALGALALVVLIICHFTFVEFQAGWPSMISVIVLCAGLQMALIGVSSIYVGRILNEVQGRPLYIVRRRVG